MYSRTKNEAGPVWPQYMRMHILITRPCLAVTGDSAVQTCEACLEVYLHLKMMATSALLMERYMVFSKQSLRKPVTSSDGCRTENTDTEYSSQVYSTRPQQRQSLRSQVANAQRTVVPRLSCETMLRSLLLPSRVDRGADQALEVSAHTHQAPSY